MLDCDGLDAANTIRPKLRQIKEQEPVGTLDVAVVVRDGETPPAESSIALRKRSYRLNRLRHVFLPKVRVLDRASFSVWLRLWARSMPRPLDVVPRRIARPQYLTAAHTSWRTAVILAALQSKAAPNASGSVLQLG